MHIMMLLRIFRRTGEKEALRMAEVRALALLLAREGEEEYARVCAYHTPLACRSSSR
jgi:hypothetical protein